MKNNNYITRNNKKIFLKHLAITAVSLTFIAGITPALTYIGLPPNLFAEISIKLLPGAAAAYSGTTAAFLGAEWLSNTILDEKAKEKTEHKAPEKLASLDAKIIKDEIDDKKSAANNKYNTNNTDNTISKDESKKL